MTSSQSFHEVAAGREVRQAGVKRVGVVSRK